MLSANVGRPRGAGFGAAAPDLELRWFDQVGSTAPGRQIRRADTAEVSVDSDAFRTQGGVGLRVRRVGNLINLSTPVGLAIALLAKAKLRPGPRGLILAEHYRFAFPVAGAFTVGNVVLTRSSFAELTVRFPQVLDHEDAHAWQYLLCLGLPFLPAYLAGSAWSWLRTGDLAAQNPFERHAGLHRGGYADVPIRPLRQAAAQVGRSIAELGRSGRRESSEKSGQA